jgi:hypothetical protein
MVISTEELKFDATIRGQVKKHSRQVATNSFMATSSAIGDMDQRKM